MRALHLIETLGRGGAENLLVTLLPELYAEGIEPIVAALRPPYDLQPELERRGVRVIRLAGFHKWNLLAARQRLIVLCEDESIDLVHAHLYFPSVYAAMVGRSGLVPVVETFHNLAYGGANRRNIKLALRRKLRGWAVRSGTTRCYGVSRAVADHYAAALNLPSVDILSNAIDLQAIDGVEVPSKGPGPKEKLRLVVPGRLVREKGHRDLIKAVSGRTGERFELHFVGAGPLESELRQMAGDLGLSLKITGSLEHDRFLYEVAQADIVVVPSRHEGFGIAAAEAMALAKPVVATLAGGLPEVVGENGLLVPVAHPRLLRKAIERLADDEGFRYELGQCAARVTRERFAPLQAARQLASAYRELTKAGGRC